MWSCNPSILLVYRFATIVADLLASNKKIEESLLRLRRTSKAVEATAGVSDDDKIREQLLLDVTDWGARVLLAPKLYSLSDTNVVCFFQIAALDVDPRTVPGFPELLRLVEDARANSSSAAAATATAPAAAPAPVPLLSAATAAPAESGDAPAASETA